MSDMAHLLIPFAAGNSPGAREAVAGLELPHLQKLLARLSPRAADAGDEHSFSPPHERALARLHGLPVEDGQIPWAARELRLRGSPSHAHPEGQAWAVITPCHWQVGTTSASMTDPMALGIVEGEAQALMEAMRPYFNEDGIELLYETPGRWLARGELFRGLPTASLDRVTGRNIDDWMPKTAQARPLRRLQNEMQMLLYTHPVNEERALRGLPPVNSFWAHGTGALPAGYAPSTLPGLTVATALRGPALREDWAAWAQAWRAIDAAECAALLAALSRGGRATLTLCGERNAQTFDAMPTTFISRIAGPLSRAFGRKNTASALEAL